MANINVIYFSYDADSAGNKIGRAILKDDLEEVKEISERIHLGNQLINRWAMEREGIQYSSGGDQGAYAIPARYENELEGMRKDYEYLTGLTISVGVGKHLSESGQALLMAKLKGKNRIVKYDEKTKREIDAIRKRTKKKRYRSMEEYKIAEAYLEKGEENVEGAEESCQYCQQSDGTDPSHCKYCHGEPSQTGEEACSYCQQSPSQAADMPELAEQDCQYCKEKDATGKDACPYCNEAPPSLVSPDSNNAQAPAGSEEEKKQYDQMGMNPPIIGKPNPAEEPPIGQNAPMDTEPVASKDGNPLIPEEGAPAGKSDPRLDGSIPEEDTHTREAMTAIADQIVAEGTPPESQVDAIDDTDLPDSQHMDGNVSRPEGFDQNTPQDMGTGGPNPPSDDADMEEPDLSSVLEEGLDDHADGIKREKCIKVVSQALMQFKNAKQELEQIKMQSPRLYQASLGLLKAMIEMAGMLDLGQPGMENAGIPQSGQTESNLGQEQASLMPPQEEQNDEWHDPFPTHPDHGGQPKPGHSPSAKDGLDSPQR